MSLIIKAFLRIFLVATLILSAVAPSCTDSTIKLGPEYKGVDPRAKPIVDWYLELSSENNIHFDKKVTIGFKSIDHGDIVGLCTYGRYFREIDIDISFWHKSTRATKIALLFHELTHCYCDRSHDYGKDKDYPEAERTRQTDIGPGYMIDGCPMSIMHPIVLEDYCLKEHFNIYTKEMFDRCSPY